MIQHVLAPSVRISHCGRRHLRPSLALTPCPRFRLLHAVGGAATADPRIHRGAGRQDYRRDDHHHHRPDARLRRHVRRFRGKLIQIVFGLSIAFAASSFFLSFFSFGGGALV
jgi:hypothetical protein